MGKHRVIDSSESEEQEPVASPKKRLRRLRRADEPGEGVVNEPAEPAPADEADELWDDAEEEAPQARAQRLRRQPSRRQSLNGGRQGLLQRQRAALEDLGAGADRVPRLSASLRCGYTVLQLLRLPLLLA